MVTHRQAMPGLAGELLLLPVAFGLTVLNTQIQILALPGNKSEGTTLELAFCKSSKTEQLEGLPALQPRPPRGFRP